ncbi:MAG: response regulator [Lachnospiraceae bacterium]|nr:response regulator [Lachnospiraceae bacterium]
MRVLAVDDDKASIKALQGFLSSLMPDAECFYYDEPLSALAKARDTEIDIAFLDVKMPELSGLDLAQYLVELNPFVNLIFFSEHTEYAYDAMKLHASGFLKKPGSESDIKNELDSLRFPSSMKRYKRVFAQTFGDFELFVDGKPVEFKYKKTKEIVAILINNKGAQTTNGEIISSLWEDDGDPEKKLSYLRNLRQDLQNTLSGLKLDGIILKQRGSMAIAKDKIECDLFDWLEKKNDSKYRYAGDYMNQYSWSEYYLAQLDEISYSLEDEE